MRSIVRRTTAAALAACALALAAAPASAARPDFTLGGRACKLIAVPAAAPVGTGSCPGVRPGAVVNSDKGSCTMNFLFNGSDGRRYIGTAGHCILGEGSVGAQDAGEQAWAPGTGPEATGSQGERIGEFAYAVLQDPKDFALVRLDPGVPASPQMCHFGGPTALNSDLASSPTLLHHFGNGLAIGSALPARTHLATSMPDPDHVFATGAAAPGDSGSGVVSADGRALGVLVTVGAHLGGLGAAGLDAGAIGITRIGPQEARAEQVLGTALSLQTAPIL